MLGRIEAVNAVLGLTGANAQTAAEDLEAMKNSLGAANDAFIEQSKAIEVRWNKAVAKITAGITKMTNAVLDAVLPIEKLTGRVAKEQVALNNLVIQVARYKVGTDERRKAIEKLNIKYGDLLGNLDAEKTSNEQLEIILKKVNDQYVGRILLAAKEDELTEIANRQADAREREGIIVDKVTKSYINRQIALGKEIDLEATFQEMLRESTISGRDRRAATLRYSRAINEQEKAQKEFNDVLDKTNQIEKDFDLSKKTIIKTTKKEIEEINKMGTAIEGVERAIRKMSEVAKVATSDTTDNFQDFVDMANEASERMEVFAENIGGAFGQGIEGGIKQGLKNALLVVVDYLQKMVLAAQVGAGARFILGDPTGILKIAGLTALFEILKGQISSFRSGVENFEGGVAKVHKDELITNLPKGSNVHTKTETAGLFDLSPLIKEIRALRGDVQILQQSRIILKGSSLVQVYDNENKKRLSNNN